MKKGTYWLFETKLKYREVNDLSIKESDLTIKEKTLTTKMLITDYISRKDGYKISVIKGSPSNFCHYHGGIITDIQTALIKTPKLEYYLVDLKNSDIKKLDRMDFVSILKYIQPFFRENIKEGDVLCKDENLDCSSEYYFACKFTSTKMLKELSNDQIKYYFMTRRLDDDQESWEVGKEYGFIKFEYTNQNTLSEVSAHLLEFHTEY
ncbi:MAG: hypothetical protein WBP45_01300 [Daejeonella sp.]